MGLFGGNKPIWMSAGLSSVKALNYVKACEDQEELVQIVLNGKLDNYKEAALLNIKDKNVLKDLAKKLDTNLAIKSGKQHKKTSRKRIRNQERWI